MASAAGYAVTMVRPFHRGPRAPWPDLAETRLVRRLVPSPLEPLALATTHEGAWYGADPTGYKFVRLGSHALNGLQTWMQVSALNLRAQYRSRHVIYAVLRRRPKKRLTWGASYKSGQ